MYLKSSELTNINGKNYLKIFLDAQYPYKVKVNGDEQDKYDILFKEPDASDLGELRKCSLAIEKLVNYRENKLIKSQAIWGSEFIKTIMESRSQENVIDPNAAQEQLEVEESDDSLDERLLEVHKGFISELLSLCSDYEDAESDYFIEVDKFFRLLEKKCYREFDDGICHSTDLSVFDAHNATSHFIKEAILIEYIAFFFKHFPSKYLQAIQG